MSVPITWTQEMLHVLRVMRSSGETLEKCSHRIGVARNVVAEKSRELGLGGKHHHAKLTPDEVREIRLELAAGFNANAIARKRGLARRTVGDVRDGKSWKNIIAVAAMVAFASTAHASPPPVGSNDWEIMMPYKFWIEHEHLPSGAWCCDWADGRPVDAEQRTDGHWWAHVTPEHFPGVADHWLMIPDDKVHKGPNPVGVPILWYSVVADYAYCFAPSTQG